MNGTDSSSVVSNDSHSFVFGSNDDKNQSRERLDNSSRSSRQQQGSIGTGSQSTNTKGLQTNSYASKKQERESVASQKSAEDVVKEFSEAIPPKRKMAASATVPVLVLKRLPMTVKMINDLLLHLVSVSASSK